MANTVDISKAMKRIPLILAVIFSVLILSPAYGWQKGIYITQSTLENTGRINYLIKQSKAVGINSFIIDFNRFSRRYQQNIKLVKKHNIKYIVRIVVFPNGGKPWQVRSKQYWQQKYRLAEQAIRLGAQEVQLDYIRYAASQRPSSQNSRDIYEVIKWFKNKLAKEGIPLQVAVFGVAAHAESKSIGQNLPLFASHVDVFCPMLYPSHYEPFLFHSRRPYQTILNSLQALHGQFNYQVPAKIYVYIEMYNYRYPLSNRAKVKYIHEQIKAVQDGNAHGWYAWNPHNHYENLFRALRTYSVK